MAGIGPVILMHQEQLADNSRCLPDDPSVLMETGDELDRLETISRLDHDHDHDDEGLEFVLSYRKASIKPPGGLFNFGPSRGDVLESGLIREGGGLLHKIIGSFSVLLSHILRNQYTILRLKYANSTQFLFQNVPKLTC